MTTKNEKERKKIISEIEEKKTEYSSLFPYTYTEEEKKYPYVQKNLKRAEEIKAEIKELQIRYEKLTP